MAEQINDEDASQNKLGTGACTPHPILITATPAVLTVHPQVRSIRGQRLTDCTAAEYAWPLSNRLLYQLMFPLEAR